MGEVKPATELFLIIPNKKGGQDMRFSKYNNKNKKRSRRRQTEESRQFEAIEAAIFAKKLGYNVEPETFYNLGKHFNK